MLTPTQKTEETNVAPIELIFDFFLISLINYFPLNPGEDRVIFLVKTKKGSSQGVYTKCVHSKLPCQCKL